MNSHTMAPERLRAVSPAAALDVSRAQLLMALRHRRHLGTLCDHAARWREAERTRLEAFIAATLAIRRELLAAGHRTRWETPPLPESAYVEVGNPHWPKLTSHGAYVSVGPHRGLFCTYVETFVGLPDRGRTQVATLRMFRDDAVARRNAARMLAAGRELVGV